MAEEKKHPGKIKQPSWLIDAVVLDGEGSGRSISYRDLSSWRPEDGLLWLHLDFKDPKSAEWIKKKSHIDPLAVDVLLDGENPRPRCLQFGNALILFLRAINTNKGKEPDDMVSLRIYCDGYRFIMLRSFPILDIKLVRMMLDSNTAPTTPGSLIDEISSTLLDRVVDSVEDVEDTVDGIEGRIVGENESDQELVSELSEIRRALSSMRRYIGPERDALSMLARQTLSWITAEERYQMGETSHRVVRILEDIDNIKERVSISMDELANKYRELSQKNMYTISVVATLFMPLTVLTGLWGMNVHALPFADHPYGFWLTMLVMVIISIVTVVVFRLIKLL